MTTLPAIKQRTLAVQLEVQYGSGDEGGDDNGEENKDPYAFTIKIEFTQLFRDKYSHLKLDANEDYARRQPSKMYPQAVILYNKSPAEMIDKIQGRGLHGKLLVETQVSNPYILKNQKVAPQYKNEQTIILDSTSEPYNDYAVEKEINNFTVNLKYKNELIRKMFEQDQSLVNRQEIMKIADELQEDHLRLIKREKLDISLSIQKNYLKAYFKDWFKQVRSQDQLMYQQKFFQQIIMVQFSQKVLIVQNLKDYINAYMHSHLGELYVDLSELREKDNDECEMVLKDNFKMGLEIAQLKGGPTYCYLNALLEPLRMYGGIVCLQLSGITIPEMRYETHERATFFNRVKKISLRASTVKEKTMNIINRELIMFGICIDFDYSDIQVIDSVKTQQEEKPKSIPIEKQSITCSSIACKMAYAEFGCLFCFSQICCRNFYFCCICGDKLNQFETGINKYMTASVQKEEIDVTEVFKTYLQQNDHDWLKYLRDCLIHRGKRKDGALIDYFFINRVDLYNSYSFTEILEELGKLQIISASFNSCNLNCEQQRGIYKMFQHSRRLIYLNIENNNYSPQALYMFVALARISPMFCICKITDSQNVLHPYMIKIQEVDKKFDEEEKIDLEGKCGSCCKIPKYKMSQIQLERQFLGYRSKNEKNDLDKIDDKQGEGISMLIKSIYDVCADNRIQSLASIFSQMQNGLDKLEDYLKYFMFRKQKPMNIRVQTDAPEFIKEVMSNFAYGNKDVIFQKMTQVYDKLQNRRYLTESQNPLQSISESIQDQYNETPLEGFIIPQRVGQDNAAITQRNSNVI